MIMISKYWYLVLFLHKSDIMWSSLWRISQWSYMQIDFSFQFWFVDVDLVHIDIWVIGKRYLKQPFYFSALSTLSFCSLRTKSGNKIVKYMMIYIQHIYFYDLLFFPSHSQNTMLENITGYQDSWDSICCHTSRCFN